jgi:rod shape-determining protein MreD
MGGRSSFSKQSGDKVIRLSKLSSVQRQIFDGLVIGFSVLLCSCLAFVRWPGMNLLGVAPDWLLIWLVTWSLKRNAFQGILAGLILGMIRDGITSAPLSGPSYVFSFILVGFLSAKLHKQRYIQEDFISVALIVFVMAIVAEGAIAIQHVIHQIRTPQEIWIDYQRIALSSALLSSLWTPVLYYPLNRWWKRLKRLEEIS